MTRSSSFQGIAKSEIDQAAWSNNPGWKVIRDDPKADWRLENPQSGEVLDKPFAQSLSSCAPSFTDVRPASASPDETGLNNPFQIQIKAFDGFTYDLLLGKQGPDKTRYLQLRVSADLPSVRTPDPKESQEDKKKKDEEFDQRNADLKQRLERETQFEKWVFLVPDWSLEQILKRRDEIVAKASPSPIPPGATPSPISSTPSPRPEASTSPSASPTPFAHVHPSALLTLTQLQRRPEPESYRRIVIGQVTKRLPSRLETCSRAIRVVVLVLENPWMAVSRSDVRNKIVARLDAAFLVLYPALFPLLRLLNPKASGQSGRKASTTVEDDSEISEIWDNLTRLAFQTSPTEARKGGSRPYCFPPEASRAFFRTFLGLCTSTG